MVIVVVLHMLRVIFYGAFKFPREITWFSGVALLLVTVGFGFTGYLLPWDQRAYWATIVGTRIAGVTPVIGDGILRIMRGGEDLSAVTLVRFFGTHVWVLPVMLISLIAFHLYLVIRIGISAVPQRKEEQDNG
jgi:quinol-cytochrome oxidoreductase complex cytochrome b subunit